MGVLLMEDDGGFDEKIIAVPSNHLHPFYQDVAEYTDLPQILLDQIHHFFSHYKDLEKGKWVKVLGWEGPDAARQEVAEGIANYKA